LLPTRLNDVTPEIVRSHLALFSECENKYSLLRKWILQELTGMATVDTQTQPKAGKSKQMTQEQVGAGFQELRNQQRAVASKISELEMERKEHE
jgi:hypothetical protein